MSYKLVVLISAVVVVIIIWNQLSEKMAMSALQNAILQNDITSAKKCLSSSPHLLSKTNEYGDTPLSLATERGAFDMATVFIDNEANIYHDSGRLGLAMQWACMYGYIDIVEKFLEVGIDLEYQSNSRGTHGSGTALIAAIDGGHFDIVQLLWLDPVKQIS